MSDEHNKPPKGTGRSSRPRAAPVIDGEAMAIPDPKPADHPAPQPALEVSTGDNTSTDASPATGDAAAGTGMAAASLSLVRPVIAGAVAGALAATIIGMAGLWLLGDGTSNTGSDDAAAAVTALEKRLRAVEARPAPAADGSGTTKLADDLAALRQNVSAIEARLAGAPATANAGLNDLASLRHSLAGLEQKIAAADNSQLAAEIATLRRDVTARSANGGGEPAALLLVATDLLKAAVDRGQTYVSELEAARGLGLSAEVVDKLSPAAASGVPTPRQLADLLSERVTLMLDSLQRKPDGVVDQLQQSFAKLVRVRPVGDVAGVDPGQRLARLEVRLQRGDVAGAVEEMSALPAPMQAAAGPLAEGLRQRVMADTLLARVIADLVKSLPRRG